MGNIKKKRGHLKIINSIENQYHHSLLMIRILPCKQHILEDYQSIFDKN